MSKREKSQAAARNDDSSLKTPKASPLPSSPSGPALDDIFGSSAKSEDMTKLDQRPKNRTRRIVISIIGILVVLFVVTLSGFLYFTKGRGKVGDQIHFSVAGPSAVASGQDVTYRISFANEERINLERAEITVQYPDGFRFATATPRASNEFNNAWSLGTLRPKGGGEIVITGQLVGELNETSVLRTKLVFRPENFNYDFEENAVTETTINASNVSLDLELPLRVISKKEFSWSVSYKNTAPTSLQRVRFVAEYPSDFTVAGVEPSALEQSRVWEFPSLESGAEGKLSIRGTINGEPGEGREFTMKVGIVEADGAFRLMGESSSILFLVRAGLTLTVTVNGSLNQSTAAWQDRLLATFSYKNDGDSEITDATLTLSFVGNDKSGERSNLLDWDTLNDSAKGKRDGTTITWTKTEIPGLKRLTPGEGGEFSVSVKLRDSPAVRSENDMNFSIVTTGRATIPNVPEFDAANFASESNPVTTVITSKVALTTEGRFYTEFAESLGSGPLPPVVGKTTTYRIFWDVTNTTNDLEAVTVKTTLPDTVLWTGRSTVSGGDALHFDSMTREVVWSIARVPAGTGQLLPTLEANFEVSITPLASDVGTVLILARKSTLAGTDRFTTAAVSTEQGLVTSELTNDVNAKGKGIVVAQ